MPERPDDRIYDLHAAVCKALAHPKRLLLLDLLRDGEECVCRLAPKVGVTQAHLSQLLAVLRRAGVVASRREGHEILYRISDPRVFQAIDPMRELLGDKLAEAHTLALEV